MHISRHSHYDQPRAVGAAEPYRPADGVFFRPEFVCHGFINDNRSRRVQRIPVSKFPPLQNGNAHAVEVVRASHAVLSTGHVFGVGRRAAFYLETPAGVSFQRQVSNRAHRNHSWYRAYVFFQIPAEERQSGRACVDGLLRKRHLHGEHILRIEPRINAEQLRCALDHEPRAR